MPDNTYQDLLDKYKKIKDVTCTDDECKNNKKLLKLQIEKEDAEIWLKTGKEKKWKAQREIIQIQKGTDILNSEVEKMAQNFSNILYELFNDVYKNIESKIDSVNIQNEYINSIHDIVDFNNTKQDELNRKYNEVINSNSMNKRLVSFYSNDEEYIKPFIAFFEKIFWPILIIITILFLFKLYKGKYPTNKDKFLNILFISFLYIMPLLFRWFANTFNIKPGYKGYESTDVLDAKRYKNLA